MSEQEFDNLNKRQRADLVWEWGYYIGSRKSATHTVALFVITDFFCEVHIRIDGNQTEEIKTVKYSELHPDFAGSIDIGSPLVKAAIAKNSHQQA